jgi:predicted small metal-binding protein
VGLDCSWHLDGENEDQMLLVIKQHAAEAHNLPRLHALAIEHVLQAIRRNP